MENEKGMKKRVLASLVMGLNCVNSFAPMAMTINVQRENVPVNPVKETVAEPEQYTAACYQALDVVDSAIFGTAEAATFTDEVNTSVNVSQIIQSGGGSTGGSVQNINNGGTVGFAYVLNGGTQSVKTGGTTISEVVSVGGTQNVEGGYVLDAWLDGGKINLNDGKIDSLMVLTTKEDSEANILGGTVNSLTHATFGTVNVSGGTVSYTHLGGTDAKFNVLDGNVENTYIDSNGVMNISGGTVSITLMGETGGTQNVSGGSVKYTVLGANNTQNIIDGIVSNTDINSGGVQNVSGGNVSDTSVNSGGVQNVSGGIIYHTLVNSGGVQNVSDGATSNTRINSGGIQNVSGGTATDNMVVSGAVQNVTGGNANNNFVYGAQNVSGGAATNNVIEAGATQNISGGTALNNMIAAGAVENIFAGGTAIENNDQNLAGTINVGSGAVEIVNDGQNIAAGAGVTVAAGGTQVVNGKVSPGAGSLIIGGTQLINAGGTATNPTLTSGAQQIVQGGTALNTEVVEGATQTITSGQAENTIIASNGIQILSGGSALNTTINSGGIQKVYSGTLGGDIINGGIKEIYSPSVTLADVTMNDGIVRFGADGGNYNITGYFAFNGGIVDMTSTPDGLSPNPRTYETLTIANLTGNNGIFKLDTDLDKAVYGSINTNGDKVVINGGITGTHYIQVADESLYTGQEITGDRKLLLVTDNSGVQDLVLEGKDLNNGGVWHTLPPQLFKEGNNWYIGYVQKEPTNDTITYLTDRKVAVYNQWTHMANDSLRKRLGDLRYNGAEAGVWARYHRGKLSGDGFDQSYNAYQVGIDKTVGQSTFGLAIEKQETSQSYDYGNGDGTTVAGNIYYTKYTDTGSYFDAILKYGKINSKYDTTGTYPDHADYDTKAYSLSLEYGKTNKYKDGYFVEPKVQLTYGHIGAENYTSDRGTLMEESAIKSLIGKVGFVAGRKVGDSDYYFKAGIFREFKGDRDVHLAAANGENMYRSEDFGDTWFELGLGGNVKLAKNTHLYGDVEKSFGGDTQKKWQINAGVRWEF